MKNLLDDDPFEPWLSEAYYLAARRRVVGHRDNTELSVIEINAGGQLLPHIQQRHLWYCCIRGEGTYTLRDQEHPFRWGDLLEIAPRTIHAFTATGTAPLYLLQFQSLEDAPLPPATWIELLGKLTGRLN
jgi:quercetin dioxygenase-like cupin family protein